MNCAQPCSGCCGCSTPVICIVCRQVIEHPERNEHAHRCLGNSGVWEQMPIRNYKPPMIAYSDEGPDAA